VRLLIDGVGQARPWVAFDVLGASGAPAVGTVVTVEREGGPAFLRMERRARSGDKAKDENLVRPA
jgi:hypothetical protein